MKLKIIYMESTLYYFHEVYGNKPHPTAASLKNSIAKTTSTGIKYLLLEEQIEDNTLPAA